MRCRQCETENAAGATYRYFFGTHAGSEYIDRRHTRTQYRIAGSEQVYLCDRCVDEHVKRRARRAGLAISLGILGFVVCCLLLPMGAVAVLGNDLTPFRALLPVVGFLLACTLVGPITCLGMRQAGKKGEGRAGAGDDLAIRLRKADLRVRGYDKFFTRAAYSRLT